MCSVQKQRVVIVFYNRDRKQEDSAGAELQCAMRDISAL